MSVFSGDPARPHEVAVVGGPGFGADWHYGEGYEGAAWVLLKHIEESGHDAHIADTMVFPLIFLCRHAIELRMKDLIEDGHCLLGTEPAPTKHNLGNLWSLCWKVIKMQWPGTQESHVAEEAAIITDFDEVDPGSTSFRYSLDAGGEPSLPPALTRLQPRKIVAAMTKVCRALEAASTGVVAEAEQRAERLGDITGE
jgi:hypothetical protein